MYGIWKLSVYLQFVWHVVYPRCLRSMRSMHVLLPRIMQGTSMATPVVAGAALLVRQYFTAGFYPEGKADSSRALNPSAALVKVCAAFALFLFLRCCSLSCCGCMCCCAVHCFLTDWMHATCVQSGKGVVPCTGADHQPASPHTRATMKGRGTMLHNTLQPTTHAGDAAGRGFCPDWF